MGTSTSGNGAQSGVASIQLPSVAWEMDEEAGGAGAPDPAAAAVPPAAVLPVAPPPVVPEYGQVAAVSTGPVAAAEPPLPPTPVVPGPVLAPVPDPEPGPEPGPTALAPVARPDRFGRARLKRPVMVAAATAGVVLMGLPFLITDGSRTGRDGTADNVGLSQADLPLPEGPEFGDPAPIDAPTDPNASGAPAAPTDPTLPPDPAAGAPTTPGADGAPGGVPGTTPGNGAAPNTAPPPGTNLLSRPAPGAKPPTTGGSGGTGGGGATGSTGSGGTGGTGGTGGSTGGSGGTGGSTGSTGGTGGSGGTAPQPPVPQQPKPQPPVPQPPVPPKPVAPTFTAVAGTGCGNSGTGYAQYGQWTNGSTGWTVNSAGGYSGSGCNGKYDSVPMSGDGKDKGNSVVWTFTTAPVTTGSCKISVYVPNSSDRKMVGGKPTVYTVQNSSMPGSGTVGEFKVDQTAARGTWASAGTFPLTGGRIAVMLHDRGIDWGGDADKAHHAAGAVRADCTG